jgi:hypothetical protein
MEGKEVLQQGLIRRIGTGEKTHAWNDNWLPRDFALQPTTCIKKDLPVLVSDFINPTSASRNSKSTKGVLSTNGYQSDPSDLDMHS